MKKLMIRLLGWVATMYVFGCGPMAVAQQINPASQIQWPKVTGTGAPASTCDSSHYGQPYTDLSTGTSYVCGTAGWYTSNSTMPDLNAACTASACNLVTLGDSTTANTPGGPGTDWPTILGGLPYFSGKATVHNLAVPGATCTSIAPQVASAVADYAPGGNTIQSIATIMVGRNNLNDSVADEMSCIDGYVSTLKAAGFDVLLMTVLPSATTAPAFPNGGMDVSTVAASYTGSQQYLTFTGTGLSFPRDYAYISNIPVMTVTPTCDVSSYAQAGTVVTVELSGCTGTFSVGQFPYFTNVTSPGDSLNTNVALGAITAASPTAITFGVTGSATISTTSVTGAVAQLYPPVQIYNGYAGSVQPGWTSTSVTLAVPGSGLDFASAALSGGQLNSVSFTAVDLITPAQLQRLQEFNEAIMGDTNGTYPPFDMSALMPYPSVTDIETPGTVDFTHPNALQNQRIAHALNSYFSAQTYIPQPQTNAMHENPQIVGAEVVGSLTCAGAAVTSYLGPTLGCYVSSGNGTLQAYDSYLEEYIPLVYRALSHDFYISGSRVLSLTSGAMTLFGNETITGGLTVQGSSASVNGSNICTQATGCGGSAHVTTTAVTSEAFTVAGVSAGGYCSVTPENATAATNLSTTYYSVSAANTVTLTHTATAGMQYTLSCTN